MRQWIIWYTIAVHFSWGIQLVLSKPEPLDAHGGLLWNIYLQVGGYGIWAWMFILVAILALTGILFNRKYPLVRLSLIIPQQFVLTVGAIGIIYALLGLGETQFTISRIMRIAPLAWGLTIFHTLSMIDLYLGKKHP